MKIVAKNVGNLLKIEELVDGKDRNFKSCSSQFLYS